MSTKLSNMRIRSKALSVLLKYPDGTTLWTRVESEDYLNALRKDGVQIVQVEKIKDDYDLKGDGKNG